MSWCRVTVLQKKPKCNTETHNIGAKWETEEPGEVAGIVGGNVASD